MKWLEAASAVFGLLAIPVGAFAIGTVGHIGSTTHALHVAVFIAGGELIAVGAAALLFAFRKQLQL